MNLFFDVICLTFAFTGVVSAQDDPIVETRLGKVRGSNQQSIVGNDYLAFKGIPYAKPPIGELRFQDPVPIEAWSETKNSTDYGPNCAQWDSSNNVADGSDDCLYLNVYTKNLQPDKKPSVMVWIHGGAFIQGSSSGGLYSPDYFMRKDIVLVSFNYRLGVLGFLNLEDEVAPGNQGLKDQVMALKWVRDNIASFGGDPEDVTIFGESAGSGSVYYQAISPMAQGLFHKAISESGVALCPWATIPDPKKYAYKLVERLGKDTKDHKEIVEYLKTVDASVLAQLQIEVLPLEDQHQLIVAAFGPGVDAKSNNPFMPIEPKEAAQKGVQVPLLFGNNNREGLLFVDPSRKAWKNVLPIAKSEFENFVHPNFAKTLKEYNLVPEDVRRMYFGNDNVTEENYDKFVDFIGDMLFVEGIHRAATIRLEKNLPTYLYQFAYDKDSFLKPFLASNMSGATHGDELRYLFRMKAIESSIPPLQEGTVPFKIMEQMIELWVNFATTGKPTPAPSELVPIEWEPLNNKTVFRRLEINENLKMNDVLNYGERLRDLQSVN